MIFILLPRDTVGNVVGGSVFIPTGPRHPTEGVLNINATDVPGAAVATATIRSRNDPGDPFTEKDVEITEADFDANGVFVLPIKLQHEMQCEISGYSDGTWNASIRT